MELSILAKGQSQFEVKLKGPGEQRYRLEASTNLTSWATIGSVTFTNTGARWRTNPPPGNQNQMFFRATPE